MLAGKVEDRGCRELAGEAGDGGGEWGRREDCPVCH